MNDKRVHKIHRALLFLMPLIIGLVAPSMITVYGQTTSGKAIVIGANYVVKGMLGAPSFSELKQDGFAIVWTIAYVNWGKQEWNKAKTWIASVKAAGFSTLIDFWGDFNTALDMTKQAAATGVDILSLDELLTSSHLTQSQLLSVIKAATKANPMVRFIMNEYNPTAIKNAYAWTVGYPVSVATDDYEDMSIIDIGIQVAQTYGKRAAAWLIFAQGSQNFSCYANLDSWITYLKQRPADAFFWYVDAAGTWKANWEKVASF